MQDTDEQKRDLVLKRMMKMPPESGKDLAKRKRVDKLIEGVNKRKRPQKSQE